MQLSENLGFALDMIYTQSVLKLEPMGTGVSEQRVTVSSKVARAAKVVEWDGKEGKRNSFGTNGP